DAIATLRHDQVAGRCTVAGDHRLDVHAVPGAGALRPRLILLAPDELLAKRLGALAIATTALELGDQLLGSLQTRLQLALLGQQLVDARAGLLGELGVRLDLLLGSFG